MPLGASGPPVFIAGRGMVPRPMGEFRAQRQTPVVSAVAATALATLGDVAIVEWVEILLDDQTLRYSREAYNGTGGPFSPRLLSMGTLRRALSDELTGSNDLPSYTVTFLDGAFIGSATQDRPIRAVYETTAWKGREIRALMSTPSELATFTEPAQLFRGAIQSVTFNDFTVTITAVDFLTAQGKTADFQAVVPKTVISQRLFRGLAADDPQLGVPLQYVFGVHDDVTGDVGPVPLIPLDLEFLPVLGLTYLRLLVTAGTIESLDAFYVGTESITLDGTDLLVPGHFGWTSRLGSAPGYRDVNGFRCTVVYAWPGAEWYDDVVSGSVTVTCTCHGIEPSGVGTGQAMTDLFQIERWIWANLILRQMVTTPLSVPLWASDGLPYLDIDSYDEAQAAGVDRYAGGIVGAFILGGATYTPTASDLIAMLRRCTDTRGYWNEAGQYAVKMRVRAEDAEAETLGIQGGAYLFADGPLAIDPLDDQHYTQYLCRFGALTGSSTGWQQDGVSIRYMPAVTTYGLRNSPVDELPALRSWDLVYTLAKYKLARHANARFSGTSVTTPLVRVTAPAFFATAAFEPGDVRTATHPLGPGATGWFRNKVTLESVDVDLDAKTVTLAMTDHVMPRAVSGVILTYSVTSITRVEVDDLWFAVVTAAASFTNVLAAGDIVTITGATPDAYNGSVMVVAVSGTTVFSYPLLEDPGADATGTLLYGTYDLGTRKVKPKKIEVVDPPTGTGPTLQGEYDLGGSNETSLSPALGTWVNLSQGKPAPIRKSLVGKRKVVAVFMIRTDDASTDITPRITLEDGTVVATSGDSSNDVDLTRMEVVLQDLKAETPIDLMVAGDQIYKAQVKRTASTAGVIFAYSWIRVH